jgi:Peptidase propeptide and YPEB domain
MRGMRERRGGQSGPHREAPPSIRPYLGPRSGGGGQGGGGIGREEARQIAANHVGGTAKAVYREDDFGAAWEVEVSTPEGEYDVYVNAAGDVVRVDGPFPD